MSTEIQGVDVQRPAISWQKGEVSHTYKLSDSDIVWLAKALWREGAPRAAVGYTLLQRFAALYPKYGTLTKFIRAYCQPLNPAWFPNGQRSKRKVARLKKAGRHIEASKEIDRAKKRIVYSQTTWEEIPQQYRDFTERLLMGAVTNPVPTAIHFCMSQAQPGSTHKESRIAAERYAVKKGLGPPLPVPGGYGSGMNWFFESKGSKPPQIAMIGTTRIKNVLLASKRTPGAAAAGLLGLALIIATRKR